VATLLSIIIPVYNEERTIGIVLEKLDTFRLDFSKEIIVIDDGSTDRSYAVVTEFFALRQNLGRVIRHSKNRGKGASIRTGLAHVNGEIVIIQDADLEYEIEDIPKLLAPIVKDEADVVFGNRFHSGSRQVPRFWRLISNRIGTLLTNIVTGLGFSDVCVGYKAFRTDVLRRVPLKSERFGFEPEIAIKVARLGCKIHEVPVRYKGRTYAEGKKITLFDVIMILPQIIRFGFFDRR